jgi:hypothetical protein
MLPLSDKYLRNKYTFFASYYRYTNEILNIIFDKWIKTMVSFPGVF